MMERLSVEIGADSIEFETGRIAKQAHGSVLCRCGETMVLSAVCVDSVARPGQDFFPLTVDYREKFYSVGQIPGNFFRRESRPSEREILVCRLTDRPLRPQFPKGFFNELQVCQTVLSADNVHDPDVLSINAASAALHISKIPLLEPIGAVRVGYIGGQLVVNPTITDIKDSDINIVMAGTRDAICMVEGQANQISEALMLDAMEFGHEYIKKIIAALDELRQRCGVEKMAVEAPKTDEQITADVEALAAARMDEALSVISKAARHDAITGLKAEVLDTLFERYGEEAFPEKQPLIAAALDALEKRLLRARVVKTNIRIDGRALDQVRPITIEVGILPRTHGSAPLYPRRNPGHRDHYTRHGPRRTAPR